jgi:predicted Zn-dependent protease with MMP-like domain
MPARGRRGGGEDRWQRLAEAETRAVMRALPARLRARAAEVPVRFEPAPGPELLAAGLPDDLLGLFSGTTCADPEGACGPMPTEIVLFIDNLREEAEDDPVRFRQEVRTTLLHELGHFLGFEEDDLGARDLG